jgi:DNA-binding FrmR family transcriptional regulator
MKPEIKKQVYNRLKRIEGQVRGLEKLVEKNSYCIDVITQTSAVRQALSSVEDVMLKNHLEEHAQHQMKGKQSKKAMKEIMEVYALAKKK